MILCIYAYLYENFGPGYGRSLQRFGVGIGALGFGALLFGVWGLGFWDNRESFILEAMGPFWGLMLPKSRARRLQSVRNSLGFRVYFLGKSLPTQGSARGTKKSVRRQGSTGHGLRRGFALSFDQGLGFRA